MRAKGIWTPDAAREHVSNPLLYLSFLWIKIKIPLQHKVFLSFLNKLSNEKLITSILIKYTKENIPYFRFYSQSSKSS